MSVPDERTIFDIYVFIIIEKSKIMNDEVYPSLYATLMIR